MGAMSRRKGNVGELEVVRILRAVFPMVRRRVSGEESQGRRGRDLDGVAPWCAQVNWSDRPRIEKKYAEAAAAVEPGEVAVLFSKRTRGRWLATMALEDWLRIEESRD